MDMKNKKIIIALLIAALVFIWGNSLLSRQASQLLSDTVQGKITQITGGDTSNGVNSAVLRKAAHFLEFAVLGGILVLLLREKKKAYLKAFLISAVCAALDETIQIFSGRGNSILDVLLDSFGAAFGVLVMFLILTKKEK